MKSMKKSTTTNILSYGIIVIFFIAVQSMLSAGAIGTQLKGLLVPVCCYIVMAISLNLTVGVLGELSLGHAGFMSVGAFAGAIACACLESVIPLGPARLAVGMIIGAFFAGVAGFLIGVPVLRLKGDYLAIVTLAFGEIIKNLALCLYVGLDGSGLHFGFLSSIRALGMETGARTIVDGPVGLQGITKISTFTSGIVLILITLIIVLNLVNSRSGRAIMALRDNRIAAESVGIPVTKYKLMAFVTSAALAGAAGCLYAMNYSTVVATKFDFNASILVLVFVVLGGLGNMWGSIIATGLLYVLPEILRQFNSDIQKYRMLIYAIVLILVMLATNNKAIRGGFAKIKNAIAQTVLRRKKAEGGEHSE